MARMHARRKGKSRSHRPYITENPDWVPLTAQEIEEKVIELRKKNLSSALIGLRLRDQFGVPSVKLATGKSITQILKEHNMAPEIPEDLRALMRKAIRAYNHLQENPKDLHNKRNLQLIESKIRRLVKYYQRINRLDPEWKYSIQNAKILVE
ncbi:MAG TPA: 30S ribosomal protein S15 [Thermoplasmata archaeon]|nr:30S ribosomal protein S15 [Thermoplasmata archaeon]